MRLLERALVLVRPFHDREDGAVTVDWVVLTASIVGLGIAVGSAIWDDASTVTDEISNAMGATVSRTSFAEGGDDGGDGGDSGSPVVPTDPNAPSIPPSDI